MPKPPVTRAYVNHARWIIECACRNASEAVSDPGTHQARLGCKTWTCPGEWGGCGATYKVVWPDRARIAAILRHRPRRSNQNWQPGETIGSLIAENLEHGCNVPDGEAGT